MKGFIIQLSYEDDNGVEGLTVKESPGQSLFMSLFNGILDDIGRLYWVNPEQFSSPFNSSYAMDESEMEFFYSDLIEEHEKKLEFDAVSPPHSIFPKYARWIRDDNTTLLGLYDRPDERLVKRLIEIGMRDYRGYFDIVDVFFHNDDASYWECFAKDGHLLKKAFESALKVVDRKYITPMDSDDRSEFYNER